MIAYKPGPMGQKFLESQAYTKLICGPIGSGKSTVALMDLVQRAVTQTVFKGVRRTKFIILRNTLQQLKSTIKPLLDQWFITMTDGTMGQWRLSDNVFEARFKLPDNTVVHSEFVMMACDSPDDVRRLLSLEASAAWVEEAREVDAEVFAGLQGRVNRFPSRIAGGVAYPGVICSTNPPPLGGFWHGLMTKPEKGIDIFTQPAALLDDGAINPEAENLNNLAPEYYSNLIAGKSSAWIEVYLKNNFGAGDIGRPVFKGSFKRAFHVSEKNLQPIVQTINPIIIGMDNGLQAAAVIMQQDAMGRVNILGECYVPEDETMGVNGFMSRLMIPKLRNEFPNIRAENIIFVLDPACWQRAQSDETTVAQVVQRCGYTVVKASTNDPIKRIGAVENLLARQIDGGPGLRIDPRCHHLITGFDWGYRYKKSAGGVSSVTPEKNHFSHLLDATHYACLHYDHQISGSAFGRPTARKLVQSTYKYV